jgi:photosystem II stability/assembly factor-like uncharacterized protein
VKIAVGAALGVLLALQPALGAYVWGGPGGGIAFVLAVARARPRTVYAATDHGGIFASVDAGATWRLATRSARPGRIRALAVGRGALYASDADGRLVVASDRGETRTVSDPDTLHGGIMSLAIDRRTSPETLYAGTSRGEVGASSDQGGHWTTSAAFDGQPVVALAVDARRHRGVVWAATAGAVFRSVDGGGRWTKIAGVDVRRLVVDPTRRHTLFVVNGGVLRSIDGGRTWRPLAPIHHALSLVIDSSTRPGTVYVGTSYTSVLRSPDAGDTWRSASGGLAPLGEVVELAVDVRTRPSTLYAGLSVLGVYRSVDAGATWARDAAPASAQSIRPAWRAATSASIASIRRITWASSSAKAARRSASRGVPASTSPRLRASRTAVATRPRETDSGLRMRRCSTYC